MADLNEPSKETVRIDLLPESVSNGLDTKSRETVRIQLGLRQPSAPVLGSAAQVLTSPEDLPPPPPLLTTPSPAVQTSISGALSSGPKQETARIAPTPDLPSKPLPTVEMKKTQPLIAMPHTPLQRASIAVAPTEKSATPLCWVLLGISAIILIIQIWTYLS
jgi:hypothetical protein